MRGIRMFQFIEFRLGYKKEKLKKKNPKNETKKNISDEVIKLMERED